MELTPLARKLRREMTEAERLLWYHLRNRRLGGLKFRRQVPIGPYIVDFLCLEKRVIVEIDGGQHNFPDERARDLERTRFLEYKGYKVLRFWNNEVLGNLEGVLSVILEACQSSFSSSWSPSS
ncbi:MAG: endonuclease domain-containing protein [Methanomassiliicoccales archaeon]|nr:endonuclease domain-containing protein [Methanomassiliicoccales archaeon]